MKYVFNSRDELVDFIASEIVNTSEAAQILDCTRQYIYKLVKSGKLRPIKEMAKDRIFLKSDVIKIKSDGD